MQRIKYVCRRCNHVELCSKKDIFSFFINQILLIVGLIAVCVIAVFGFIVHQNPLTAGLSETISYSMTDVAKTYDMELRDVALNLTPNCTGGYSECYIRSIYTGLEGLRYVPTSKYRILYHPLYVYNNGGDCRNTAILVVSLMRSLGFDAEVECNVNYGHCVAVVPLKNSWEKNYDLYVVADLANKEYFMKAKGQDFWSYYDQLT